MRIRVATSKDVQAWAGLRAELWPDTSPSTHRAEIAAILAKPDTEQVAFLGTDGTEEPVVLAEVALRRDHVNGCDTTPVAFLEGIVVRAGQQRRGLGRQMLDAVRSWAHMQGCTELASDADLSNTSSHAFHEAVGFQETLRAVFFRMRL